MDGLSVEPGVAVVNDVLKVFLEGELGVKSTSKKFHLRMHF